MSIKPNPKFINSVPAEARKKWHDALVTCEKPQGAGSMIDDNGGWCCLMVGYAAFGGRGRKSVAGYGAPPSESRFARAMKDDSPKIAQSEISGSWRADYVNDVLGYTFPQIARLVYPEAYEGEAA